MQILSIITCSYNSDSQILNRTLHAVQQLTVPKGIQLEYIIVDNNSEPALVARPEFADFFASNKEWVKIVVESTPGLTAARLKGIHESTGPLIVFFDDDNEPHSDYLVQIMRLREEQPEVAIWSPGNVWVEFIGTPDPWTRRYAMEKLQELHLSERKFSKDLQHFEYVPYGTGMVAERAILEAYAQKVVTGAYTASDRKGSSLSSSGDIQIVYTAATFNKAVGRAPELKIQHLIAASKSNFNYIKRLYYGCSIDGFSVAAQSFPGKNLEKANPLSDTLKFITYNTYYFLKMGLVQGNIRIWKCQTAGMIATVEGKYNYYQKPLPLYMKMLKRYLKL